MTAIKICGLTNLEDARWAARCGADLLGFIFVSGSPRYVAPEAAALLTQTLRAEGVRAQLVGVFADESAEKVRAIATACALDLVQLHGHESPAYAARLGRPYLLARRVGDTLSWEDLARYAAWGYLLDTYDAGKLGGTGQTWDWRILGAADRKLPARLIIAGGLTPENVAQAVRQVHPWGVDVASGVEARPGIKDPAKVERFIQSVREAETRS
ncbi:MAG: phosphoribosylanthranilate isomerase [Anaerolineae bacterium]|nr:phosphoribosylanthranilate isomerase [Anaerolineae bacterium]